MSLRYDPLLARALAREILDRWGGTLITGLRMETGRRAVELTFEDGSRLVALLHPLHGHIYGLGPDDPPTGIAGKPLRIGRLRLISAETPADERALLLTLGDRTGRPWESLGIELQTQRWNAVHCRKVEDDDAASTAVTPKWRIETSLLPREAGDRSLRRGAIYELPESTRRGIAVPPAETEWEAALETSTDGSPEAEADAKPGLASGSDGDGAAAARTRRTVLETWAWSSTLNIDWILARDDTPRSDAEPSDDGATRYARYRDLRAIADAEDAASARPAWVLERRWGPQPYPHPLGNGREEPAGLLRAAAAIVEEAGGASGLLASIRSRDRPEEGDETGRLRKKLESRRKRLTRRLAALERQLEAAGPPDEPRAIGQLLLARKSDVPKGASVVTLEGFDGASREIPLDPARNAVANAESFFDEARRRERALERLPASIDEAARRVAALDDAIDRLDRSGPSDELWDVVGGRPPAAKGRTPGRGRPETRLPYTRLRSSGGLEIRLGRGAKENDDLTFRHSAPDDIWLHASQASGAHVILRWGRKDENPPRRDLLEAATAAAVHSGARHSGTVPVVWTRRKHVRKPRKSPPGTVSPSRVETLFVSPDERLVRSLRENAEGPSA